MPFVAALQYIPQLFARKMGNVPPSQLVEDVQRSKLPSRAQGPASLVARAKNSNGIAVPYRHVIDFLYGCLGARGVLSPRS